MSGRWVPNSFANRPEITSGSAGFTPQAITRTSNSFSLGSGRGASSYFNTSGAPYSCATTAFMVAVVWPNAAVLRNSRPNIWRIRLIGPISPVLESFSQTGCGHGFSRYRLSCPRRERKGRVNPTRIRVACFIVAQASCLWGEWASSPFFETDSTGETPIGPTGKVPVLLQDRVGPVDHTVLHHAVDV